MEGASRAKGDLAFDQRYAMSPPASQLITVSREQLKRAGDEPARGWQTYSAFPSDGNPTEFAHDPVSVAKNFRNLEVDHSWVRGKVMDPLTAALQAAQAGRVDPGDFRTLGENASLLRPLIWRGFKDWKLQKRIPRDGNVCHDWRPGVLRVPNASGAYSQRVL